jgi:hypothetical protein
LQQHPRKSSPLPSESKTSSIHSAVQVNACIDEHLIKIGEIAQRPRNVGKNIDLIICSFSPLSGGVLSMFRGGLHSRAMLRVGLRWLVFRKPIPERER